MRRAAHTLELEEPIHAELFGSERLQQHAASLAAAQTVTPRPRRVPSLLARVRDNHRALISAYGAIANAVREERAITPAAEWFVDNFHLAEDQVREILEDLPPGYYRKLAKLAGGPLAGYPRVFGIAWAYVAHTESRFDPETFLAFVRAYQRVQVLTIGELWALAISVRIVLVENLRRHADQIVQRRAAREAADRLADECLGLVPGTTAPLGERLRDLAGARLQTAFCVQLVMRLRDQDPTLTPVLRWLDERLAEQSKNADELVQREHQRQGTTNVIVRNVITSMRLISALDWADFHEEVSLVEQALRRHAAYSAMDFATRDRYRHAVEQLARATGLSEVEIAERAVTRSLQARDESCDSGDVGHARRADPGYWLIAEGRRHFARELERRPPRSSRPAHGSRRIATWVYLGAIALGSLALVAVPLAAAHGAGASAAALLGLFAIALLPASDLAIALVQRCVTAWRLPAFLPRLHLRDGVPDSLRTIVVVPSMLGDVDQVERQVHALAILYLANSRGAVHFALLSDWRDAASETMPGDEELVAAAAAGIARLNDQHGPAPGGTPRFLLLHRRRLHNVREGKWMGWERKRGKLHEFARLLRGARDTTFTTAANAVLPEGVRYVVTLDADTRLPRDAVSRLVGGIAHPLNRACFDPALGRVVAGYGVLQPKITPTLTEPQETSVYQRIYSRHAGMDPYAFAVSDVYQDLFGEGSYVGKGIYDLDAFEAALAGRVPENALLSHDLFEGLFARVGLDTQTELFEDTPSHVLVAAARQHRWARGDWQLLPWIVHPSRRVAGAPDTAPMPWLSRWKMLDNLRRSLSSPAIVGLFVGAWIVPGAAPSRWMGLLLAVIVLPAILPVLDGLVPRRRGISLRAHFRALFADAAAALMQVGLAVVLLPHQAWLMLDAILRTLVRLLFTRRRLLQWVTAAQATALAQLDVASFYRSMAGSLGLVAATAIAILTLATPQALPIAIPLLVLWTLAPLFATLASRGPRRAPHEPLAAEQARTLRLIARRTWRFFATFVDARSHDLPPDNFQDAPAPVLAHRTSPTNIGLYLLSATTARDFGWVGTREAVERIERTLATMRRLDRLHGHFLNWYDTGDLRPLEPRYVSTVDSGNLAGHLLAVEQACRAMLDGPVPFARVITGIEDAVGIARQTLLLLADDRGTSTVTHAQMADAGERLTVLLRSAAAGAGDRVAQLDTLRREAREFADIARALHRERGDEAGLELSAAAETVLATIESHRRDLGPDEAAGDLERRIATIAHACGEIAMAMDFRFLYDETRKLFAIGAHAPDGKLDPSFYDLLASEARLASFFAIAKGDVPVEHWFHLGRALTPTRHGAALISWSGSMFEYLMPALVMRSPPASLLDRTYDATVRRQIDYGRKRGVPWGVSESAYHRRDLQQTYQYSSFGVPGLGLKRGLSEDVVIAPYATALAAMVDPVAAVNNFAQIDREGGRGAYGYYDALDYNAERLPAGARVGVVRTYMAHHHGMAIVAIANVLLDGIVRARFHSQPIVEATELLLQERTPRDVAFARPRADEVAASVHVRELVPPVVRRFSSPHDLTPRSQLLSNGRYTVMVTAAGSGYSRWRELAVTRWREDATRDTHGNHVFLRDVGTGEVWSAGWQPSGAEPDSYEVGFAEDRVEIVRRDGALSTTLEIVVSPEDDAEVRRVSIRNLGTRTHEIDVTSYTEVVLAPAADDEAHPAFAKLFVQTEAAPPWNALFATRRPRAPGDAQAWAGQVIVVQGEVVGELQSETDRARFLGRGRELRAAAAVRDGRPLSGTIGPVLDPVFSLRRRVRIEPGGTARVLFSTFVASSRDQAFALADKARDPGIFERTWTMAWTQGQVQLHHLGIEQDEAHLFQRLANRIVFFDPTLRGATEILKRNVHGARILWGHGISGDLPIVLVRIDDAEELGIVRQILRAWQYWRLKRLAVDLVLLNERASSYVQDLQNALETLLRTSQSAVRQQDQPRGGVFILRGDLVTPEQRDALVTLARIVLLSRRGTLAEQVLRPQRTDQPPPAPRKTRVAPERARPTPRQLEFYNGLGGFARDGREYAITLGEGQWTPAPWINVIADETFGFQVSESGSGYTWSRNSRENKLTPWSNDPVSDPPGEAIYLRDEETYELWTPTALPIRLAGATYEAAHGRGYSRFELEAHGIASVLVQFVLPDAPVKVSRLSLENRSSRPRSLSLTAYVEWVLGVTRGASAAFVVTEIDHSTGALLARNACNGEFAGRIAFVDLWPRATEWTGDRTEFVGRNGTLEQPAALARRERLSRRVGAGLDTCGALKTFIQLAPHARTEVVVFLGEAETREAARHAIERARGADLDGALGAVSTRWQSLLEDVQITTPDRAMDILLGRWLPYQALACRLWSRSAFYQSGGAYGFRDQLQDVMAFTATQPGLARAHIVRCAARQFVEGDVQHWWHPPSGRGVRTRCSDDLVWLPYVVHHFIDVTGDATILDEPIPFLAGPPLVTGAEDAYFEPTVDEQQASLFEHCARALERSLATGPHRLPLIGSGDWNDGMNRIGLLGKGESTWLAWLLHTTLWEFAKLAAARGEAGRAETWRLHVSALKAAIEAEAWDGAWYRRAFDDAGAPLGSAANDECQIDSIAQSWGVISGAAEPARAERAMAAVYERLVQPADRVVRLFAPPFDKTAQDVGYIKGYLPGVRENGGQYTHAAVWTLIAFAALGDGDKAMEIFSLLNPIRHADTRAGVHRYKVEPYVLAGDVYAEPPHVGRGGWTWYTGAAAWLYRAGIEWVLGLRVRRGRLFVDPCIPRAWPAYEIRFRDRATVFDISVRNPSGVTRGVVSIELDGESLPVPSAGIVLTGDSGTHRVVVTLGP